MNGDIVVLGSYPDGVLESNDLSQYPNRWSGWRHGNSVPHALWKSAEPFLRATITNRGYFCVYPYYGGKLPVEYEFRIKDFRIFDKPQVAPGLTFADQSEMTAHVWLHFQKALKLSHPLPQNLFYERPLANGVFAAPIPIMEVAWLQMYKTGVIFAEIIVPTST